MQSTTQKSLGFGRKLIPYFTEGSVSRLAGVGGRESRRQAYTDVFTQHLYSIVH